MVCATIWDVSIRRACNVLTACRSSYHYKPHKDDQANLKQRIREIAETHLRYGYRHIHVLLRREGWQVNTKYIYRLYTTMGLQVAEQNTEAACESKDVVRTFKMSARRLVIQKLLVLTMDPNLSFVILISELIKITWFSVSPDQ